MTVCTAKTQISLGIRPVWSESSLCAQWEAKDPSVLHVDSEDFMRMPRLIWIFAGRTCHFVGFVMRRLIWGTPIQIAIKWCNFEKRPVSYTRDNRRQTKKCTNWYIMKQRLTLVKSFSAEVKEWILMNFFKTIESKRHRKTLIPVNTS